MGKRCVTEPTATGRGSPAACDQPARHGARPGDRDLLADHGADGELEAVGGARHAAARVSPHHGTDQRVVAQRLPDGDRVGVEVEQLAAARHRRVQVAQVREHELAFDVGGPVPALSVVRARAQRDDAVPVGEAQAARVGDPVERLDAGERAQAQEVQHRRRVEGPAAGETKGDGLGGRLSGGSGAPWAVRAARARSPLGVSANVWRTVSLHWRTLEKPAAKATWATGRSVVSSRIRAVWLRCARARASGPVPTSAVMSRFSWRVL